MVKGYLILNLSIVGGSSRWA